MDRKQIIEGPQELARGERLTFENQADVCSAAIAELKALALTPEQRAQRAKKRMAARCRDATTVDVYTSGGVFIAQIRFGTLGTPDAETHAANGRTPDEAVDRLLARVK